MSKSYYPTDRAGQIDWHKNFAREFPKIGEKLGFTGAEIANAVNDSNYAVYLLEALGPEIESNPLHAAHAVMEGQSQGAYVDLPSTEAAPTAVRPMPPSPPVIAVPPTMTDAIAGRSSWFARLGEPLESRAARIVPASAARSPLAAKAMIFVRSTSTPAAHAAGSPAPIARQ